MGPLDAPEEVQGNAFETLIFQELKTANDYFNLGYSINYWRSANDTEVDFVLYGPRGIKALEVKRTARVFSLSLNGLKSFIADYPSAKAFFLYGGSRKMHEQGIEIIPVEEFLKKLPEFLR